MPKQPSKKNKTGRHARTAAGPRKRGSLQLSLAELDPKVMELLHGGATRRDLMQTMGVSTPSAFNKKLVRLSKKYMVTIDRDPRSAGGTGDDAVYRACGAGLMSLELSKETALPAALVLADFAQQALGTAGMGAKRFSKALVSRLDADLQQRFARLRDRVKFRFFESPQGIPGVIDCFLDAIADSKTIRIVYESIASMRRVDSAEDAAALGSGRARRRKENWREVEVHGLFFARRSLFAVVRSVGPEPDRAKAAQHIEAPYNVSPSLWHVKLERVKKFERCTRSVVPIRDFTIDGWLRQGWEVFFEDKPFTDVVVRIDQTVAERLGSTVFHPTQTIKRRADGSCDYTFSVRGFNEIRYWLAWFGPGVEVIKPPELRLEMRQMIAEMAKRYEEP